MTDYLDLSPVPTDEEVQQVGPLHDPIQARRECRAMVNQLNRQFPPIGNVRYIIKSNPHDFGDYLSVVAKFDDENENECDFVYNVEANIPEKWDELAKAELNLK
jgi:hypothetical protein